jgi:cell division protein FtsA
MDTKKVLVALRCWNNKSLYHHVAAPKKNGFDILGLGSHPSYGLKKGSVVNIEKTILSIKESLNQAKLMSGMDHIYEVTVGIAGNHIYCFNSSGVVPVKGKEITASPMLKEF